MKDTHVPPKLTRLESHDAFVARHVGPDEGEIAIMLSRMGTSGLDQLINDIVPANIRLRQPLALAEPVDEPAALARLQRMAQRNRPCKSLIGLGYYGTHTPPVILRNVVENPGWYTAYTPYQAEIAQGRLEALLNFQQMVIDLTGLELANASLLDEATSAAEAMAMARRLNKTKSNAFFVDQACYPQTLDVLATRAKHFGFELVLGPAEQADEHDVFGALFQNPDERGRVRDLSPILEAARRRGTITAVATDPMALILIRPPGELGADIVFGSAQRFGVPMGFGGPHAAFFATRREYLRAIPGRIIGVSRDKRNRPALRMALQTREQHIRRERATSNICTSQVLLANMAGFYAVYHGPEGLRAIAERIHRMAAILAEGLRRTGIKLAAEPFFDTLCVHSATQTQQWLKAAETRQIDLRRVDPDHIGISIDETVTREELESLLNIFGVKDSVDELDHAVCDGRPILPPALQRRTPVLEHPVFHEHRTEHRMLRYLRTLQNRDLALDHSMIPLGSCTMKLSASSEMLPISWSAFAHVHPFTPVEQTKGYLELIESLSGYLKAVTGFPALSLQPNSGALGEYAGLVAIARYHAARGEAHRDVCLVPRSAHGTNPASAQMCGMRVVEIECDAEGNVDLEDLRDKCSHHQSELAALMLTYPSTHGVFEPAVRELCDCVHAHGGQVYMDGANLNAQIGLTSPAALGADVAHINLHKTFCIPHGGGGPGMGPIGVATHLAPFLPDHTLIPTGNAQRPNKGQGAVAAAPYGSASILPISWMYITMMGREGLKHATRIALLNANYLAARLAPHYMVLFTGEHGRVAHECIIDIRPIRQASGISEVDIAKRLMDYGFHAPTMSFPVAGTMMIEPTESEGLDELDRFVEAMIRIRQEIHSVEQGNWPADDNPLVNAPHTQADLVDDWTHPYSRETAVFPLAWLREHKFWPSVNRIDDVYGDRHLFCGCVPPVD